VEFWELVEVVSILGSVIERLLKTIDYTREETKGNEIQNKEGRKEGNPDQSRLLQVIG